MPVPIPPINEYFPQRVKGDKIDSLEAHPKSDEKFKVRGIVNTSSFVVHFPADNWAYD